MSEILRKYKKLFLIATCAMFVWISGVVVVNGMLTARANTSPTNWFTQTAITGNLSDGTLLGENEVIITLVNSTAINNATEIHWPDTFNGRTVVEIRGSTAFKQAATVTLPENLRVIGNDAMYGTLITSITIPDSVTSIGHSAFRGCTSLTSITIPDSVTSIGVSAFQGCTGLTSITIPESVTSIWLSAFSDCRGLTSITIPDSVTTIGDFAFQGCTGLTSITIPDSVTSIGRAAFQSCTNLANITIGTGVTSIGTGAFSFTRYMTDRPNQVLYIGNYLICWSGTMPANRTISITTGTRVIAEGAFAYRTQLASITIPNSVTNIGNGAFRDCTGLTNITIPNSVTSIGSSAYTIEGGAFQGCTNLANITIGTGVTSIGNSAFQGCTGLTSITIPNSVTSIGVSAFQGCTGLTSVTIGTGVTSIGQGAFMNCSGLTSITIPNSVTSIGGENQFADGAFQGCTGLTSVTIETGVTSIGAHTFRDCTSLTNITIPDSVTNIETNAFQGCTSLTNITIGTGVTTIVSTAFIYTNLTNITFSGNAVFRLEGNSIIRNSNNELILGTNLSVIPNTVTAIGARAFIGRRDMTSITIPDSVIMIADFAFTNCTGLTSITIPDGVSHIGWGVFDGCTNLTSITMKGATPPTLANINAIPAATTHIYVPFGAGDTYRSAPNWSNATIAPRIVELDPPCHDCGESPCTCPCDHHTFPPTWTITTPATCTTNGFEIRHCLDCTHTETQPIIATDHTFTNWTTITPSTCTTDGLEQRECTRTGCTHTETNVLEAPGHNHQWIETTPATCTTDAIESYQCTTCDHIADTNTIDDSALNHTYPPSWTTETPATCTADGLESRTCTRPGCDHVDTRPITANPCNQEGCQGCFPPCGVGECDWPDEYQTVNPPTCTSNGLESRTCTVAHCDNIDTRPIIAPGHTLEWDETTPATCTTDAIESEKCTVCNHIEATRFVTDTATGHRWTHWEPSLLPTCTADGLEIRTCRDCPEQETNILSAITHTHVWTQTSPATCTTDAIESNKCDCGHISDTRPGTPATGHTWTDWAIQTPPTCTSVGIETRHCITCTHPETNILPATPCGTCEVCDPPVIVEPEPDPCTPEDPCEEKTCPRCEPLIVYQPPGSDPLGNLIRNPILWALAGIFAIFGILFIIIGVNKRKEKEKKAVNIPKSSS